MHDDHSQNSSGGPSPDQRETEVQPIKETRAATGPRRRSWFTPRVRSYLILAALGTIVLVALLALLIPAWVEHLQYVAERGRLRAQKEERHNSPAEDQPRSSEPAKTVLLPELSQAYENVTKGVADSVVHIQTRGAGKDQSPRDELLHLFGPPDPDKLPKQGSGVVVDPSGYLLTNEHVVRGADVVQVAMGDDRKMKAEVIGVDPVTDLALLRVDAQGLTPIQWGDSSQLHVGALVWAIGSPFGLERSVTFGIVSAKDRKTLPGSPYQDLLQIDAALNPGSSGGPLVDAEGRVVGINTAILGESFRGISFAIPSNVAQEVSHQLKSTGRMSRGWLGVALDTVSPQQAQQAGLDQPRGAYVVSVIGGDDSPAGKAGIERGDIIVSWDGHQIENPTMLSRLVAKVAIGSKVQAGIVREGQSLQLEVVVAQRPDEG